VLDELKSARQSRRMGPAEEPDLQLMLEEIGDAEAEPVRSDTTTSWR
jgi:hypothetical protein